MESAIPTTMRAYRFKPSVADPVCEKIDVPRPGPDEVLLKILAAGVCHSDITFLDPNNPISKLASDTLTMGHEGAGIIVMLGSEVLSSHPCLTLGTYVAMYSTNPCFQPTCDACSRGRPNVCQAHLGYGLQTDGSWATYMVIRAASVVPVPAGPDSISPSVVSAATDAVLTPYHAMKTCARLRPEHTVLCIGVGGVGLNGISIAKKCLGVHCLIACDTRVSALQNAKAEGADHIVTPENLRGLLKKNHLSVDFAFDFVGTQETFQACFGAINVGGTIHLVGLGAPSLSIMPLVTMMKEFIFRTSFYGTKDELSEILHAIKDGVLKPKVEARPMSQCVQVLEDMRKGKLTSRIALIPDDFPEINISAL